MDNSQDKPTFTYRHKDGHILTVKEVNKLDYDSAPGVVQQIERIPMDKYEHLSEDKIREVVRDVFNVPPAPTVYYTSVAGEIAFKKAMLESLEAKGFKIGEQVGDWEQELRDKLNAEIPDGTYDCGGLITGKGGYIEFTIALHKQMRKLYDSQSYQKQG